MVEHEVVMLSRVVMHAVRVGRSPAGVCDRPHVIEASPLLRESIIALRALGELPRPARMAALQALILDEVLHSPALPLSIPLPQDKRLRSLCEQLIANPRSDRTLEDWARHIGASSRTVERLFNDALGVTFRQWRQSVRLAHAVALIAQGRSIAYAAAAAGYATQSAFTAMFRKAFGKAPREFLNGARRSHRRAE